MTSKKIGLLAAIVVQTNAMIGAGVVAIPGILAHTTGPIGLIPYLVCLIIILCMTFSLGELSLLHGGEGWCYRFPKILGGHTLAMTTSFFYVGGVLVAMGFVAKQAGVWLHESIPGLSPSLLAFLSLLLFSFLVYAGKNLSSFGQFCISAVVMLGLLITSAICLTHFNPELLTIKYEGGLAPILRITPILLFSFLGFECISSLYAIMENPRKNVLKGGIIGVLIVAALYLIFSGSVLGSIPSSYFLGKENYSLAKILSITFPNYYFLTKLVYLGGLFAILGTLHSMIWSISVLLMDVWKKAKSPTVHSLLEKNVINQTSSIFLAFVVIALASFTLTNESIASLAVLLISASYIFSIGALFKEKDHKIQNRLICIFGLFGAFLMILFAAYSLIAPIFA